jgi:hypothetical protein
MLPNQLAEALTLLTGRSEVSVRNPAGTEATMVKFFVVFLIAFKEMY